MKLLHTSDWHLGHKLYGRQRYPEHAAFLNWLLECIEQEHIEALVVAGDIFDSQTPSNKSLAMYYDFLARTANSCCRYIIIVGGNHDSPTLLNGPQQLLQSLNIHVLGRASENITDEIILLKNHVGIAELIVLAVPYLRDQDIRSSVSGESIGDKHDQMLQGIAAHYARLARHAEKIQKELPHPIPCIATGHLFCQGGKTRQGDGVRELYVGTLVQVGLDQFPDSIDYLALGHLHQAQRIAGQDNKRYCGAPLAMSFSEGSENKKVLIVNTDPPCKVQEIDVPIFQRLCQIRGDLPAILLKLTELTQLQKSILIEIHYEGKSLVDDLQEQIYSAVEKSQLKVLRISNQRVYNHILKQSSGIKTLEELSPQQVFQQCMDLSEIPREQQQEMKQIFAIALDNLETEEKRQL